MEVVSEGRLKFESQYFPVSSDCEPRRLSPSLFFQGDDEGFKPDVVPAPSQF